jgi:hypothetical protein
VPSPAAKGRAALRATGRRGKLAVAAVKPRDVPVGAGHADPLGRSLARAVAERTVQQNIDEIAENLSINIAAHDNYKVFLELQVEADHLALIADSFRAKKGISLRDALISANRQGEHRDKNFVRALAVLYGGATGDRQRWAQMGLALIPMGTRDLDLIRLLEEGKLAERKALKAHYDKAFHGIGKTANDTLEEHIVNDTEGWERERALALLDHELTKADHLALVTTAIRSAHDEAALAILHEVWRADPQKKAFDELFEDWERFVHGPGFTKFGLEEAMEDELTGRHLEAARLLFGEYHEMRRKLGLHKHASMEGHEGSIERAATRMEESTITLGLTSGWFSARGDLVCPAAAHLRQAWAVRIKRDPSEASIWEVRRKQLDAELQRSSLSDAYKVEARIKLAREPTFADEVYIAYRHGDWRKLVAAVTDAWIDGSEGELERALRHPPESDWPRPPLKESERVTPFNDDSALVYDALTHPGLSHVERGALRLQIALGGSNTTKASDLEGTYQFLATIEDRAEERGSDGKHKKKPRKKGEQPSHKLRTQVLEAYIKRYLEHGGAAEGKGTLKEGPLGGSTSPEARFCEALQSKGSDFEESPMMINIIQLLVPANDLESAHELAKRREKATHSGILDPVAMALVAIYDTTTGEDTVEVAADSLLLLRDWVTRSKVEPDELRALMAAVDASSVAELAEIGYKRFSERLDAVRHVKSSVVEGLGMFVDLVGRSLLVAVAGATGPAGLMAALGAYSAGMLLREGLLGAEYQLISKENLSTLVGEVATFGFDELKIENVIKEMIPKGSAVGMFGKEGMTEAQAKFCQDYLKAGGSKTFEKAAQNWVEGKELPGAEDLLSRATHALAAAGLKPIADKISATPTVFTPTLTRFREHLKKIIVNGPPPKAAIGYAMTKELTDMLMSPGWSNMTLEEKLSRMLKTGLISIASAIPVSAAFTRLGVKDADRAKKLGAANPGVFYARLAADPVLSVAYSQYRGSLKGLPGVIPKTFQQWVELHGPIDKAQVLVVENAGRHDSQEKQVPLEKPASDVLKEMDAVMATKQ